LSDTKITELEENTWELTVWPTDHLTYQPLDHRPLDLPTIWPTNHLTYRPLDLPTTWPTDHLTYRSFDLPTTWPTDHLTYRPLDLPTIWPTDHLTYWPFDLPGFGYFAECSFPELWFMGKFTAEVQFNCTG
jgi:hypothetical protein